VRTVSTTHEGKLRQLVNNDESDTESHRDADCCQGRDSGRGRRLPLEMAASLGSKPSDKAAWDQLESSRLGSDHACMSSDQRVRRQYENIAFQDGESLDDFTMRHAKMVHELEILGDPEEPRKVAAKYPRVMPKRFDPVTLK
jgi:hypothetical protein